MSIASTIAVSGLSLARLRLQVAAGNIANASSDGPLPGTPNPENFPSVYSPLRVNQVDDLGAEPAPPLRPSTRSVTYADGFGMVARRRPPRQRAGADVDRPAQLRGQRSGHPRRPAYQRCVVRHQRLIKILR